MTFFGGMRNAKWGNSRGAAPGEEDRPATRAKRPLKLTNLNLKTSSSGFVLVAVLLIVALATIVVVTTSMIAQVERTAAGNALAMERARANALFALDVALDQLQTAAGPDQRVSARADILEGGGSTLTQPYWTGVWKSHNPANPNNYELDVSVNALRPWSYASPTWLVSQPDPSNPFVSETFPPAGGIHMATLPALGNSTSNSTEVRVPRVSLMEAAGSNKTAGAYAYWIQDEGIKAKVNLVPNAASNDPNNPVRYLAPATTAAELALEGNWRDNMRNFLGGNTDDLSKVKTPAMLDFVLGGNFSADTDGLATSSPDLTTHSFGVLSDTRKGGLKTDLTAAFESLNSNTTTTAGFFEMLCQRQPAGRDATGGGVDDAWAGKLWRVPGVSPVSSAYLDGNRWYPLYHYYNLYKSRIPRYRANESQWNPVRRRGLGGVGGQSADYDCARRGPSNAILVGGLLPELVGLRFGVYFSTINGGTGIRFHYAPRLVLHNPYSVSINPGVDFTQTSLVDFQFTNNFLNMNGLNVTIRNLTTGEILYSGLPNPQGSNPNIGPANSNLNFEPGEVKIFGGNGARNTLSYARYNDPAEYPLVSDFTDSFNFYDPTLSGALAPGDSLEITVTTRVSDANSVRWLYAVQSVGLGQVRRNPMVADALTTVVSGEPASAFLANAGDPPTPLFVIFMRAKGLFAENAPFVPAAGYSGALWNPYCISKNSFMWETDVVFKATYDEFDEMQTDGEGRSFWYQSDVGRGGGETHIVFAEIYDLPLVSLVQLRHARGFLPMGGMGGSDTSLEQFHQSFPALGTSWSNPEINNTTLPNQTDLWLFNGQTALAVDDIFLNNEALFDRFFFSTVPPAVLPPDTVVPSEWQGFDQASVEAGTSLLSPRLSYYRKDGQTPSLDDLRDMDHAAANLLVDGAFNINSTSVAAWRALLGSLRFIEAPSGAYPVPRIVSHLTTAASSSITEDLNQGIRVLSETQLEALAGAIVNQVRLRGPFLNLADFVNRRRTAGDLGTKGALQAAIDSSGINDAALGILGRRTDLTGPKPGDGMILLPENFNFVQGIPSVPENTAAGAPGVITQADLLQPLAPFLTARSDTFGIRVFGESGVTLPGGGYRAEGKVYGEAIVQRLPEFVDQTDAALEANNATLGKVAGNATPMADLGPINQKLGRRFQIISFRWLHPDEI